MYIHVYNLPKAIPTFLSTNYCMSDSREGEILYTLYTKWRVLYIHEAYSLNMFYAQKHGLVEAGKRGSRQHSTQGR